MSDIVKDINNIWSREFDHRGFVGGEINLFLQEFEQKRGDSDVDQLFKIIENITDIRDTGIDRFKQAANEVLTEANGDLGRALTVAEGLADIGSHQKTTALEEARRQRKDDWESFMDYITVTYSEINSKSESKQEQLKSYYSDLEKKLHQKT